MRKITLLVLFFTTVFAKIEISSFESNFKQIIKEEAGKTIEYFGRLYFKKPLKVLWRYEKPIKKDIYIVGNKVVVIEPELEQITISHLEKTKNIIDILKKAKKIGDKKYKAIYYNQTYYIFFDKNNHLKKITFKDKVDNKVEIIFYNTKQNIKIEDKIFKYRIDPDFDVIFQ